MATNLLDLANYVQGQGELGRQRKVRDVLSGAAADAFAAETPEAQRAAVSTAIRNDPQSGFALNSQVADENTRRGTQLYNMARGLKAIQERNPTAAAAYYEQQLVPGLRRMGLEVPDTYDAQRVGAGIDQVLAMWGPTGSLVQSTYVNGNGDRVAILRDGTERVLGPNSATIKVVEQEGQVPVGVVTSGGRAGSTVAIGGGAPTQAAPASTQVGSTSVAIDGVAPDRAKRIATVADSMRQAGYPDAEIDAWVSSQSDAAPAAAAAPAQAPATPALVRTPTAAETARATQDAKNASDLDNYSRMTNLVAGREAATTAAKAGAEAQAAQQYGTDDSRKAAREASAKLPQLNNAVRGLQRIDTALSALGGGILSDTGPIDQYAQRYTKQGQELEAAVGAIQNSILALTRVPGVGSQSDLEQRVAMLQYPSLDKNPETNRNTLNNLRLFMQDLQDAYRNVTSGAAPTASAPRTPVPAAAPDAAPRAKNPRTGEIIEFRNGQWGPAR